jgi:uncharacterized protein YbaR (Trm112 family)
LAILIYIITQKIPVTAASTMLSEIAREIHTHTNTRLLSHVAPILKCPTCGISDFEIHCDTSTPIEFLTHGVMVCHACKTCYRFDDGILHLLIEEPAPLTLAQRTNFMTGIAAHYQWGWRSWCMGLFCGRKFPNATEAEKLIAMLEWDGLPPDPVFVDFGTSHGFYAITIAKKLAETNRAGLVIALDFSRKMLVRAYASAVKHDVADKILWILADVEKTPMADASVDRVSCGGSLNEYQRPQAAMAEAQRILKENSIYYAMNLFLKRGAAGSLQKLFAFLLGLSYYPADEWNRLFTLNKFTISKQDRIGAVLFTVLRK